MKKLILIALLLITSVNFAQTKIATTESGEKILLKNDKTWEYFNASASSAPTCVVDNDFKETKWTSTKIRTRNKTTLNDLKKQISADFETDVSKIKLLSFSEKSASGVYVLCVNGKEIKYQRTGNIFKKK